MIRILYIVFLRIPRTDGTAADGGRNESAPSVGPWRGDVSNASLCPRLGVAVLVWRSSFPLHPMIDWSLS